MPKQRITKEMVVNAAFELARDGQQVIIKNIAKRLNCSVQPIYSYCNNMEGLRDEVAGKARIFLQQYMETHIDPKDPFRTTGQAYLQLAKEEPHILKLYITSKRNNVSSLDELYRMEANPQMAEAIAQSLHISAECAKALHLHMIIYTIGLGTISSVSSPGISAEEIFQQQEQAYLAFLHTFTNT